jgi:hypothetical protein
MQRQTQPQHLKKPQSHLSMESQNCTIPRYLVEGFLEVEL